MEESDLFGGKLELAELPQSHDSLKGYLSPSHNDTGRHPRKPPGLFWKPILQKSTSLKTNMAGKSPFSNTRSSNCWVFRCHSLVFGGVRYYSLPTLFEAPDFLNHQPCVCVCQPSGSG